MLFDMQCNTSPKLHSALPPHCCYRKTNIIPTAEVTAGQTAYQQEQQILNSMESRDIQNLYLFNITADPYEKTDLSQVS